MAIYPDKKNGELTGRFAVEVQLRGQRLRGRKDTLAEAKVLEAEFEQRLKDGTADEAKRKFTAKASRPATLSEGIKRAEGLLWTGLASRDGNFQKLNTIVSIVGDVRLDAFGQEAVDDLMLELEKDRSDKTLNRYLSALSVFLKWCQKRDYRTAPLPSLDWRDEDQGRIRWLTTDEERDVATIMRGDCGLLISPAIRTGMRQSELLSLEDHQLPDGWVHLWKTKNKEARSVPADEETLDVLRYLVRVGMPSATKLRYEWNLAREAMGLADDKDFVFHACRHTTATRMVQADVNLRVIQKFMGHKSIQTTLRYAHVNDNLLTAALLKTANVHGQGVYARRPGIGHNSVGRRWVREERGCWSERKVLVAPASHAGVAKLVDAPDLGSGIERCGGSSFLDDDVLE